MSLPPLPPASLPHSTSTVKVYMIETTTRIDGMLTSLLFSDPIPGFCQINDMPAWAFLIEHTVSGMRIMFDLGARTDWAEKAPPAVKQEIGANGWTVNVQHGIEHILLEQGLTPSDIDAVVWSHMHWDHVGNMDCFPPEVPLIVGPGFQDEFFPAWPDDNESAVDGAAWRGGRGFVELSTLAVGGGKRNTALYFDPPSTAATVKEENTILELLRKAPTTTLSSLPALDVFGDGSFYLLSTPGHTTAHLCALARTGPSFPSKQSKSEPQNCQSESESEFILLAADAFDNSGQIRPSPHTHLPPALRDELATQHPALLARTIQEEDIANNVQRDHDEGKTRTEAVTYSQPFLRPEAEDVHAAQASLRGLMALDARNDVLTLCAHERYHSLAWPADTPDIRPQGTEAATGAGAVTGAGTGLAEQPELGFRYFPECMNGWKDRRDGLGRNLRDVCFWWFLRDYGLNLISPNPAV